MAELLQSGMRDGPLYRLRSWAPGFLGLVMAAFIGAGCGGQSEEEEITDIILEKGARRPQVIALAKEKGVEGLAPHVKSENPRVRMVVITALGTFKDNEKATDILLDVLKRSEDTTDLYYAIIALAEQGAPQAKEIIEKHFKSDSARLREAAVLAIGKLGDKSLYPLVMEAMRDPAPLVQRRAGFVNEEYGIEDSLQR